MKGRDKRKKAKQKKLTREVVDAKNNLAHATVLCGTDPIGYILDGFIEGSRRNGGERLHLLSIVSAGCTE